MRSLIRWGCLGLVAFLLSPASPARAIILYGADNGRITTAPTGAFADSGWQYQGSWGVGAGTAIAPNYFITARHLGGSPGDVFSVNGTNYTAISAVDDPTGTDLRIWKVAQTFSTYAPLYKGTGEVTGNPVMTVFGRGTDRGAAIPDHGYLWGAQDGQMSWGTNRVTFVTQDPLGPSGDFLGFEFSPINGNATLSAGDSGGGLFIKDAGGNWSLAGVNYGVDNGWSTTPDSGYFSASMYDARGFYFGDPSNHILISGTTPIWQSAYSSRISTRADWIASVVGTAVPEPSAGALLLMGAGVMFVGRLKRRRSA